MDKKFSEITNESRTIEVKEVVFPIINLDPHVKVTPVVLTTRAQVRRFAATGRY